MFYLRSKEKAPDRCPGASIPAASTPDTRLVLVKFQRQQLCEFVLLPERMWPSRWREHQPPRHDCHCPHNPRHYPDQGFVSFNHIGVKCVNPGSVATGPVDRLLPSREGNLEEQQKREPNTAQHTHSTPGRRACSLFIVSSLSLNCLILLCLVSRHSRGSLVCCQGCALLGALLGMQQIRMAKDF